MPASVTRRLVAVGALAASAAGVGIVVGRSGATGSARRPAGSSTATTERRTAEVRRGPLESTTTYSGRLGYGATRPLLLTRPGTLTRLPAVGEVIAPGSPVAEIDGRPVIAARGAFPFWRDLHTGVSDGKDVAQLELMLLAFGTADAAGVKVDEHFDDATRRALRAFESTHGMDADGVLQMGELVVVDGPVRISAVTGVLGDQSSAAGLTVSAAEPRVQVSVPLAAASRFVAGAPVTLGLPDGTSVAGSVVSAGSPVTDGQGTTTVPVSIESTSVGSLAADTPVEVRMRHELARDVLTVPVEALLALAEGGYAVEVSDRPGSTHLVGVRVGRFADGRVAVDPSGAGGTLGAGSRVVIP